MKVIDLRLESGEMVRVKPLSQFLRIKLAKKAETIYPYPDKKPYEREVNPEVAAVPGMKIPAEQNEEYQKLRKEVDALRAFWVYNQEIILSVEPLNITREELILQYRDELASFRDVLDSEMPDDTWQATLLMCVIRSDIDRLNIVAITHERAALTEVEGQDGLRIFRPTVQWRADTKDAGQPSASDAEPPQEPLHAEHDAVGRNGSGAAVVTPA